MISLFHVDMVYPGNVQALTDVCLEVAKGEFVFVTGSSGAGKTTLLKLILGAEKATRGQIIVNGRNITRIRRSKIAHFRRQIGFIFQDFKLLPHKTVFDNVAIAKEVAGGAPKEIRKSTYLALQSVGLKDKRDKKPPSLSGGEQQRVAIARALVNDPVLILADEPTGNLDHDLAMEIMGQLMKVNEKGTTILIATHDKELVRRFGMKQVVLEKGRIVDICF